LGNYWLSAEEKGYYMAWDRVWEQIFVESDWGQYPGEDLIRFVARNFYKTPDRKKISFLEMGCGTGANLWYLAREGFTINGIDGSESAISKCKSRLDREFGTWSGSVSVRDFSTAGGLLPFGDSSIDAVIDCEAVYCNSFEDSMAIYRDAYRVLKPGGVIFVRTFASGCYGMNTGHRVAEDAWMCDVGPLAGKGYSRFTSEEKIPDLLENFKIGEIELIERSWLGYKSGHKIREWIIIGKKSEV
jgi:SAM-dependent methyltransferase